MSTYSESFNNLHKLSIDANTVIEDFDARDPVELAARNIASYLGLLATTLNDGALCWRDAALAEIGGLTKDEWDNIRFTMLGNIQLISRANIEYKNRRIDWIRDIDTVYAFGTDGHAR